MVNGAMRANQKLSPSRAPHGWAPEAHIAMLTPRPARNSNTPNRRGMVRFRRIYGLSRVAGMLLQELSARRERVSVAPRGQTGTDRASSPVSPRSPLIALF